MKKLYIFLLLSIISSLPAAAQNSEFDGLTLLGTGGTLTDKESNSTMTLRAFHTKYKEEIVGIYIQQHGHEVRFYMNSETWDQVKQKLVKSRDQWQTLAPTEFAKTGTVKGYRIANQRATLRLSIQGATELDNKRLNLSLTGGADRPQRAFISINLDQLKKLVEQLYKVDEILG